MSTLENLVVPIATYLGIKYAGNAFPSVAAVSAGVSLVKKIDSGMERDAVNAVLSANRNPDGTTPPIILLSSWDPAKKVFEKGGGRPLGKSDLQRWVEKNGGTAWFQVGANMRMEAYWHSSKAFTPKSPRESNRLELSLGYVVHGTTDAK